MSVSVRVHGDASNPCITTSVRAFDTQRAVSQQIPGSQVSTGSQALICGGYTSKTSSATAFAGDGKTLECWFFTPTPHARFDELNLKSGSAKPQARWGHASAQDPNLGHVLVFGGMTEGNTALDDCWFLHLRNPVQPAGMYEWFRSYMLGAW